jgi:hypothetical protein
MKSFVVISLCITLLSLSVVEAAPGNIPTITIYTEPPELEIWADGEYLGVGDAVLFGPFEDYVEVTVRGEGYVETTQVIDPPTEEDEDVVIIITGEKTRGVSWPSIGIGAALGIGSFIMIFGGFFIGSFG